jgi:hypothetical protein
MCSLHFKQLEGKFDTWLSKDKGSQGMPIGTVIEEMRVAIYWDDTKQDYSRKIGVRWVPDDDELQKLLGQMYDQYKAMNKPDTSLTIDGDIKVPWHAIVTVINLAKRVGIEKIEFAFGTGKDPTKS